MTHFLTTRELTDLLQIDRTTIYRMADAGRIPAVKVGNQWRFPREGVQRWLSGETEMADTRRADKGRADKGRADASSEEFRREFPLECVQQIQDVLAEALGVMLVIVDLAGTPLTHPSHPCGLYQALDAQPAAQARCIELWARLGKAPGLQPVWVESHAGPLLARALIRVGSDLRAMLIAGGIAPAAWPPNDFQAAALAQHLGIERSLLDEHIHEVFHLSEAEQARVLGLVQRVADVVAHILHERHLLSAQLVEIAALTRIEPV